MGRRGKDVESYFNGQSGPLRKRKNSRKKLKRNPEKDRKPKYVVLRKDLHGFGLHQAETAIKKMIEESISHNFSIEFCHGHNSGTQIRDFIRDGKLDQFINSKGYRLEIWYKDSGNTYVEPA